MPKFINTDLPPIDIEDEPMGKRIARIRKCNGLTQAELARKIGIARHVIADYESGRHRIYDELIIRIALALKITTDELLGLKPQKSYTNKPTLKISKKIVRLNNLPEVEKQFIIEELESLLEAAENKKKKK